MIPLINHDFQWGPSQVVIIYPDIQCCNGALIDSLASGHPFSLIVLATQATNQLPMSLDSSRNPLQTNTLVGGSPTPLKNDGVKVSWDDDIPNWMGKYKKKCSKPPTSTSTTVISTEAPVAKAEETGSTILHPVKQFGAHKRG